MLNHTPTSNPGAASKASQPANCFHASNARRQSPPVFPSTNSGTTSVKPRTTRASKSQEGIPRC